MSKVTQLFAVNSYQRAEDCDYEIVEFNTDNEEYAEQWVYAANRTANDPYAYGWEPVDFRSRT